MYFGATIFKTMSQSANVDAGLLTQIIINGTGVLFTVIAIATVDQWGRRPLMLIGTAGMGIALVPEGRRVFPSLTVFENLQIGAYGGRKGDWSTDSVMELFPLLKPLVKRQASSLSGGEQQALAIGRALMSNPQLLLLDEVSLGLAPVVIKRIYEAMVLLVGTGTTILVVEQDVQHVLTVADHVACFLEGRISLEGKPSDLSSEAITAAYFGM
jgi:branched-chain amino acid transport system ATP-binding protein